MKYNLFHEFLMMLKNKKHIYNKSTKSILHIQLYNNCKILLPYLHNNGITIALLK